MAPHRLGRRQFLGAAAAGLLGTAAVGTEAGAAGAAGAAAQRGTARAAAGSVRAAGSLPDPSAPVGVDRVPQIENFVVVMMENHSFDNILGLLGRGDGFPHLSGGRPDLALPDGHGNLVRAFHMPSECQTEGVNNDWNCAHHSLDGGTNRGFVQSSTGEAVGYFLADDVPFTWGLAKSFPIADRWFCSVPGQTNPNRRYLMAATSLGQVADTYPTDLPPNGTIFDSLNRQGISWRNYYSDLPSIGVWLPLLGHPSITANMDKIDRFYQDAAAGQLTQFSFLEPNYSHSSEEDPQDIQFGDQFLAGIVDAVMRGPQWSKTMLIWTYDEWGGYYDHVVPPAAVPPDDVAPQLSPNMVPGSFDRYGFRVPGGVVSSYARKDFVSHTVYDHTSVLKTLERKWNLPALTRRDANAHDLFDMLDLQGPPAFATPPRLPKPANPARSQSCLVTGPGPIPPPSALERGAVPDTPTISPVTLPQGAVGTPYAAKVQATRVGSGARWAVLSDDLPEGLVLDPDSGAISGTPTTAGTAGFVLGVQWRSGPVGSRHYSATITGA